MPMAGAGFRTVVAPAACPQTRASRTTCRGIFVAHQQHVASQAAEPGQAIAHVPAVDGAVRPRHYRDLVLTRGVDKDQGDAGRLPRQ